MIQSHFSMTVPIEMICIITKVQGSSSIFYKAEAAQCNAVINKPKVIIIHSQKKKQVEVRKGPLLSNFRGRGSGKNKR